MKMMPKPTRRLSDQFTYINRQFSAVIGRLEQLRDNGGITQEQGELLDSALDAAYKGRNAMVGATVSLLDLIPTRDGSDDNIHAE